MEQAIDKTMVARAVITKIEDELKPKAIKAQHVLGYDSPNKIAYRGNDESCMPDITAVYENSTSVYEIELKENSSIDKWRLLSSYARKNNGNLYLVVPDFLKEPIKKQVKENDINAGVIYFNT